jgi:hypothetical protein
MRNDRRSTLPRHAGGIVERGIGSETVLYDSRSDRVHLLDPLAAAVWLRCDGRSCDEAELTASLREIDPGADSRTIEAALNRLADLDLVDPGLSRRRLLTRTAAAGTGAVVLPVVTSIIGPIAAAHASTPHTIVLLSTAQKGGRRDPAVQACDSATGRYIAAYAYADSTYSTVAGTGWVSFNDDGNGGTQHYYYRIPFTLLAGYHYASIAVTAFVDDSTVIWLGAPTAALGGTQIGTLSGWTGTASTVTYNGAPGWKAGTQYLYFVEYNSGGGLEGIDFSATITYTT